MTLTAIVSSILGVGTVALTILSQVELWQRKEYRWDRMHSLLTSPDNKALFVPWVVPGALLVDAAWLLFFYDRFSIAEIVGWLALLAFVFHHIYRIKKRGIFRPVFTTKVLLISTALIAICLLYLFVTFTTQQFVALQWATLLLFLPFFAALTVRAINIPVGLRKRQIIERAFQLRQNLSDLKVVGITGSFGKTSTKYFLSQILDSAHLPFLSTAEHRNAELPVAQDMLQQLTSKTKLYLVEMAAYTKGEIKALTTLTKPQIGAITGIGNQHLDLFGSQQAILQAKWELIESLPPDGQAVLNADDALLVKKAASLSVHIIWYSLSQVKDIWVSDVKLEDTYITCLLHIGSESQSVTIPLASEALLGSVLAAVALAKALDVPAQEVFKAVEHLKPYTRTMEIRTGKNSSTIIDDSYSANEQGTLLAIKHLARFKQPDKRIVLLPLIELGAETEAVHERIGQALAASQAEVYIAGTAFGSSSKLHSMSDPQELAAALHTNISADTVILLEGRVPDIVRQTVL